ncbi:MAG: hypothetical protein AAGJ81_14565 [Verrucomicrobiota bacterium]
MNTSDLSYSQRRKLFWAIMALIAIGFASFWIVLKIVLGDMRIGVFSITSVIIFFDLIAFVVIGVVLKKQLRLREKDRLSDP